MKKRGKGKEKRPEKVTNAVNLLWIGIGLGVINVFLTLINSINTMEDSSLITYFILQSLFTIAILSFLIYMIGKGRNWARITFLVLFIAGALIIIPQLIILLMTNTFIGILTLIHSILQLIALVLLFEKTSSDWFKSKKK